MQVLSLVPGLLPRCLLHTVHTLQYVTKAGEEPVNKDATATTTSYRFCRGECKTWTLDYRLDHELFPSKKIALLMLVLPSVLVSDGMHPLDLLSDLTFVSKTRQQVKRSKVTCMLISIYFNSAAADGCIWVG